VNKSTGPASFSGKSEISKCDPSSLWKGKKIKWDEMEEKEMNWIERERKLSD
jgi:hypothetical protein